MRKKAFNASFGQDVEAGDTVVQEEASFTFEELLPPTKNSTIVAAHGLLHVLTLVTKGLLRAEQQQHFGTIALSLNGGSTAQA
jgi:hypothetical protein